MTWATERTDGEIHSFSHWAIMTRGTERTDSEIHSFSHWAIMTRAWRGQAVRYIHSPTELSWPGPWRGQTVRYIHAPTELSWLTLLCVTSFISEGLVLPMRESKCGKRLHNYAYTRYRCFQRWPGLSNGFCFPDQCLWLMLSSLHEP